MSAQAWDPTLMCGSVSAGVRAEKLVDEGLSVEDAKSKVRQEFPEVFASAQAASMTEQGAATTTMAQIAAGDKVMVLAGKYAGSMATIESITDKMAKLLIAGTGELTGGIPRGQFVAKGDAITSVSGKYEGKVGTVSTISAKSVKLLIDATETGSVPWDSIRLEATDGADTSTESIESDVPKASAAPKKTSGYAAVGNATVLAESDSVMVLSGEYAGKMATIQSMTDKTARLVVDGKTTGSVPLKQFIAKGDAVTSVSGKYKDKVGIVDGITSQSVTLLIDGETTGSVPWSSIAKGVMDQEDGNK